MKNTLVGRLVQRVALWRLFRLVLQKRCSHDQIWYQSHHQLSSSHPNTTTDCPPFSTFQLVVQISAIDKDITPRDVKFKFSLSTEDSNFTLTDNHGMHQSSQLGYWQGQGHSYLSLEAPGSRTKPTKWGQALTGVFKLQDTLYNSLWGCAMIRANLAKLPSPHSP